MDTSNDLSRRYEQLNEIGEPLNLYCRLSPDILPHPQACLVTGIGPQVIAERGLPEAEFMARLHAEMAVPGCWNAVARYWRTAVAARRKRPSGWRRPGPPGPVACIRWACRKTCCAR